MTKRVMVDMSATLLHHGHIRLLQRAAEMGRVIVGLTSDDEITRSKGYIPELSFSERREILLELRSVSEVVETPWLITEEILDQHRIDLLVHGDDNSNPIQPDRTILFPRTEGVSSWELRERAVSAILSNIDSGEASTKSGLAEIADSLRTILAADGRGRAIQF